MIIQKPKKKYGLLGFQTACRSALGCPNQPYNFLIQPVAINVTGLRIGTEKWYISVPNWMFGYIES